MESYYYNQLGKSGQAAYHAMLTGLRAIAPAFPVPRLEPGQLSEIFLKLRLDHPEIFSDQMKHISIMDHFSTRVAVAICIYR